MKKRHLYIGLAIVLSVILLLCKSDFNNRQIPATDMPFKHNNIQPVRVQPSEGKPNKNRDTAVLKKPGWSQSLR